MAGYSDESKYRIDPNITTKIMDSKGVNYGHAISKMFDGLGAIETQKEKQIKEDEDRELKNSMARLTMDNAKQEAIIKGISLDEIQKKIADKNNFSTIVTSQNPQETFKDIKFNNPEFYATTQDYLTKSKNALRDEQKEGHFKAAVTKFTGEDGVFKIDDAIKHLDTQYKSGSIDEATFHNVTDALREKSQTGIYTPKTTAKDALSIQKTLIDMTKSQAQIDKIKYDMANGGSKNYSKSELGKEFDDLVAMGYTPDEAKSIATNKKTMGTGLRDIEYADTKLSDALISKDKVKMQSAANLYARANPDVKNVDKAFRAISPTAYQFEEAQKLIKTKGAGAGDEIKNIFAQYTGLAWDETTQEGRTAFLSILQPMAKANISGAASDRDLKMMQDGFATLYKSDAAVANALKNKLGQSVANLKPYALAHPQYAEARGYDTTLTLLENLMGNGNSTQATQKKVTRVIGQESQQQQQTPQQRKVVKTGTDKSSGRKIQMFEDGSVEYAD